MSNETKEEKKKSKNRLKKIAAIIVLIGLILYFLEPIYTQQVLEHAFSKRE